MEEIEPVKPVSLTQFTMNSGRSFRVKDLLVKNEKALPESNSRPRKHKMKDLAHVLPLPKALPTLHLQTKMGDISTPD